MADGFAERRERANEHLIDQAVDMLAGRIVVAELAAGRLAENPLTARPRWKKALAEQVARMRQEGV